MLLVGDPDVGEVYDAAPAVEPKVGCPVNVTLRSPTEWEEGDEPFERAVKSASTDRSAMTTLDELRNRGLIEVVEPDQATATQWLDDAGRHLEAATKIAGLYPSGAYVLA